jgi:hypothetical protein
MISASCTKVEYGDFQTPLVLAEQICQKLISLGLKPDLIVEPTCGVSNFVNAAASSFPTATRIIGLEINSAYVQVSKAENQILQDNRIEIYQADFFQFDWSLLMEQLGGEILVLGNFPWVTNAQQGSFGGENLPLKTNFQQHRGLDALTGKSNFDISEWMLIQVVQWLQGRDAHLAMLCKTSVARKILKYIQANHLNLANCKTFNIDARKYFDATVEACLLVCQFDRSSRNYACSVFESLTHSDFHQIGYRNNILIRDLATFDRLERLYDKAPPNQARSGKWRSGIKHDCSGVMELRRVKGALLNGLGETVEIEETCLFPLLKGSDVAQNRGEQTNRFVVVTQKYVGEPTEQLRELAPKTWCYLENHGQALDFRKSKIYQGAPRFSIFGVGAYTFAPWKIAICGLYKKLEFRLISPIMGKPVVFDDTVYFLSFEDEQSAQDTLRLLTSAEVSGFYTSLIFWDEKRPIKASILNCLNLNAL